MSSKKFELCNKPFGLQTSESLHLLVFGLLDLICDLSNDKVLRAQLPYGIYQGIQATGVLCQDVQQHRCPLCLCGPTADFLCIVPCQDPTRAQVVEVVSAPDPVAEVVPQPGQHLGKEKRRRTSRQGPEQETTAGDNNKCPRPEITSIYYLWYVQWFYPLSG